MNYWRAKMKLNLKNVDVKTKVDSVEIEGYGTYASHDFLGTTMTKPFNGIKGKDGWHRPYFNPKPISVEQVVNSSKQYLIVMFKECLKILNNNMEIQQISLAVNVEKTNIQRKLDENLKCRQLIKSKFKKGDFSQKEYQLLMKSLNNEKFYLQKSLENCFKSFYEKQFGVSSINNLEEAVKILQDYLKESEKEENEVSPTCEGLKEFIEDELENIDYMKNQMITLKKKDTGLPMVVFVDEGGINNFGNYKPRIKFCNNHKKDYSYENTLSMTIDKKNPIVYPNHLDKLNLTSEDILILQKWVKLNYNVLIKLWKKNYINYSRIKTIKMLKKNIKIVEIDENFDMKKAEPGILYVMDINTHEGSYVDQLGKLFYGTEIQSEDEYCCSKRFISVNEDREKALRTLQKGVEQYKKEHENCYNSQLFVSESDIEHFMKSYSSMLGYVEYDSGLKCRCTFNMLTVELYNSKNYAILDI